MKQSLLVKYLSKGCSPEEQAEVEAWLEASPTHRDSLERMRRLWEASPAEVSDYEPDTDAAWAQLTQRIGAVSSRPLWRQARFWSVAAAVVFLVAAGFWFRDRYGDPEPAWMVYVSAEKIRQLPLPDGSVVTLNRNSRLEVSPDFRSQRATRLQGEAFFVVAPDAEHPFTVSIDEARIAVLGTRFNVREGKEVAVVVEEGKVAFSAGKESDSLHLAAGQAARWAPGQAMPSREASPDPNLEAWRTGKLVFTESSLRYILEILQDTYGVNVEAEPEMLDCAITARFSGNTLEQVLEVLAAATSAELTQTDQGWKLTGGTC